MSNKSEVNQFELAAVQENAEICRVRIEATKNGYRLFDSLDYDLGQGRVWSFKEAEDLLNRCACLELFGADDPSDLSDDEIFASIVEMVIEEAAA